MNREDDRFFHDAIEESHGERAIREIVSPFLEVHVGSECSGALLVPQVDDLIEQVSRLRAFLPLDSVAPEGVNN